MLIVGSNVLKLCRLRRTLVEGYGLISTAFGSLTCNEISTTWAFPLFASRKVAAAVGNRTHVLGLSSLTPWPLRHRRGCIDLVCKKPSQGFVFCLRFGLLKVWQSIKPRWLDWWFCSSVHFFWKWWSFFCWALSRKLKKMKEFSCVHRFH